MTSRLGTFRTLGATAAIAVVLLGVTAGGSAAGADNTGPTAAVAMTGVHAFDAADRAAYPAPRLRYLQLQVDVTYHCPPDTPLTEQFVSFNFPDIDVQPTSVVGTCDNADHRASIFGVVTNDPESEGPLAYIAYIESGGLGVQGVDASGGEDTNAHQPLPPNVTTLYDPTFLPGPEYDGYQSTSSTISFQWHRPFTTGERRLLRYNIVRNTHIVASVGPTVQHYTLTGLAPGTRYKIQIIAVTNNGTSKSFLEELCTTPIGNHCSGTT